MSDFPMSSSDPDECGGSGGGSESDGEGGVNDSILFPEEDGHEHHIHDDDEDDDDDDDIDDIHMDDEDSEEDEQALLQLDAHEGQSDSEEEPNEGAKSMEVHRLMLEEEQRFLDRLRADAESTAPSINENRSGRSNRRSGGGLWAMRSGRPDGNNTNTNSTSNAAGSTSSNGAAAIAATSAGATTSSSSSRRIPSAPHSISADFGFELPMLSDTSGSDAFRDALRRELDSDAFSFSSYMRSTAAELSNSESAAHPISVPHSYIDTSDFTSRHRELQAFLNGSTSSSSSDLAGRLPRSSSQFPSSLASLLGGSDRIRLTLSSSTNSNSNTNSSSSATGGNIGYTREDFVRVKTEPLSEEELHAQNKQKETSTASSSSDAAAAAANSSSPSIRPASPRQRDAYSLLESIMAAQQSSSLDVSSAGASTSESVGTSQLLTRSPSAFILLMQQQLLANIPSTIQFLFGVVEEKLEQLRGTHCAEQPQQRKSTTDTVPLPLPSQASASASAAESSTAAAVQSSSPSLAPTNSLDEAWRTGRSWDSEFHWPPPSSSSTLPSPLPPPIPTVPAVTQSSAAATSSSSAPKAPTPGSIASQRILLEKLKSIQSVLDVPLVSKSSHDGSNAIDADRSSPSPSSSGVVAAPPVTESSFSDEESAYRTVLIHALITLNAVCQRAKSMQKCIDSARGAATATSTSTNGSFPSWFPSDRAALWKLNICESLQFLENNSNNTSPSSASTGVTAVTGDLTKHLHTILCFLCGGSESEAWLLRDTFVYEYEFSNLFNLFGVSVTEAGSDELMAHVNSETGTLVSSSYTAWSNEIASALTSAVLAQRSLPYPKRVQLLTSVRKIVALSSKRRDTFLAFMLNKSKQMHNINQQRNINEMDEAKTQKKADQDTEMRTEKDAATTDAACLSESGTELIPAPPRAKLIYFLYLLSVFLQMDDEEELPAIMSMLGIIAEYQPLTDSAYMGKHRSAVTAAQNAASSNTRAASPPVLQPMHLWSSPPPTSASAASAMDEPLLRTASGTTLMSLLHGNQEPLTSVPESKQAEEKESEEKLATDGPKELPVALDLPSLLSPLFSVVLEHRPENLIGFIQRHLLENGYITIREHAYSFLFLLWRSLSTANRRRHFFNHIFTLFLDGGAAARHSNGSANAAVSASSTAQTSLAFYGENARQYLNLFRRILDDSKHALVSMKKSTSSLASKSTSSKDSSKGAEKDDDDAEDESIPSDNEDEEMMDETSSKDKKKWKSSRVDVVSDVCVSGLTSSDCTVAVRKLLHCMSAQSAAFIDHPLASTYSKLATYFALTPKQHYIQSCTCSICNGRSSAPLIDTIPNTSTASGGGTSNSIPVGLNKHRSASGLTFSYTSHPRFSDTANTESSNLPSHPLKDYAIEQKFTHCSRAIRLVGLQTIYQMTLKVSSVPQVPVASSSSNTGSSASSSSSRHRSSLASDGSSLAGTALKHIRRVDIYFSDRVGVELSSLPIPTYITKQSSSGPQSALNLSGNEHWTLGVSKEIADSTSREFEIKIPLPLGMNASALLIHFSTFHEHFQTLNEPIVCPRCSIPVSSRTSQCSRCRETVGQCTGCRAIDYEHPDAFLCSECSRSRYGSFTMYLQCKSSSRVTPIIDEAQRKACMVRIAALQERISAVLRDDMQRVINKIDARWKDGATRLPIHSNMNLNEDATASPTTVARLSKRRTTPLLAMESRSSSGSATIATGFASPYPRTLIQEVYEADASVAHSKLNALFRELQLNRLELFIYLHKTAFHLQRNIETVITDESLQPTHIVRDLSATNCYSCAKHFLLLALSTLEYVSEDWLISAHLANICSEDTSHRDMELLFYFIRHASTDNVHNPFKLEAPFIQRVASTLMCTLVKGAERSIISAPLSSDAVDARWIQDRLESTLVHHIQRGGSSMESLTALMSPLLELVRVDLSLIRHAVSSVHPLYLRGVSARIQTLFRILLVSIYSHGEISTAVVNAILLPILKLMVNATGPNKNSNRAAIRGKKSLATKVSGASIVAPHSKKQLAVRHSRTSSSNYDPYKQLQEMQEALRRQIDGASATISGGNTSEERQLSRQLSRDTSGIQREVHPSSIQTAAPSVDSAISRAMERHAESHRAAHAALAEVMSQQRQRQSDRSERDTFERYSAAVQSSVIPSNLPLAIRRVSSHSSAQPPTSSSLNPVSLPARRSNFTRSPTIRPTNSPHSSRLGRASRVPLSSNSAPPPQISPPTESRSSSSVAPTLPPLSLSQDQRQPRLFVQSLLQCDLNSLLHAAIPGWLLSDQTPTTLSSLANLDIWAEGQKLEVGEHALPSSAQSSADASVPVGPMRIGPHHVHISEQDAQCRHFPLVALLFNPVSLMLRHLTAQVVWNLSYPTLANQLLHQMVYKTPKRKSKGSAGAENVTAAAEPKAAPATDASERPVAFVRALTEIFRQLKGSQMIFSLQFFKLFTHILHSSGMTGLCAQLKQTVGTPDILQLIVSRFDAQLQMLESEERNIDFIGHAHGLSCISLSSASGNADVHRHHGLYGLSMLLSCLLSDPLVLARFSSLPRMSAQMMSCFLRIRGLMLVHTSWLDKCSKNLAFIVNTLFNNSGTEAEKRATLQAYVFALGSGKSNDATALIDSNSVPMDVIDVSPSTSVSAPLTPHISLFILEQLCSLIKPPKLEQQCLITFKKSPSQEEYIRGNMRRAPYLSSSFLPTATGGATGASTSSAVSGSASGGTSAPSGVVLMRHIKEAICTQLKLPNEENMIELLVGGKIVGMDVPVLRMYNRWYQEQVESGHAQSHSGVVAVAGTTSSFARTHSGVLLVQASPSMSPHTHDNDDEDDIANIGANMDDDTGGLLSESSQAQSSVLLAGELPMQILYRLTGLDGEASEEKIDSIADEEKKQIDPEEEFALAGALGADGLRVLLVRLDQSLRTIHALEEDVEVRLVGLLLKLFNYAINIKSNRAALLKIPAPSALRASAVPFCFQVLVEKLVLTLRATANTTIPASSASAVPATAGVSSTAVSPIIGLSLPLLSILTPLLADFAVQGQAELQLIDSVEQNPSWRVPSEQLHSLLACLSLPSVRSQSDLYHRLLACVPLLSFGQRPLLAAVEAHFTRGLDLTAFDANPRNTAAEAQLEALAILTEEIPRGQIVEKEASKNISKQTLIPSPIGAAIRDYFFASGLVSRLFTYLQQAATGDVKEGENTVPIPTVVNSKKKRGRDTDVIDSSLNQLVTCAALPYVLRVLTSLSYGHPPSQCLAASRSSALRILQQTEGMASSSRVGPLAESLLQALMLNNDTVSDAVAELRGQKKQEKKKKALDQRAKLLAQMGFTSSGSGKGSVSGKVGSGSSVAAQYASGLDSLSESEHALRCLVCLEGYEYQLSQMGFYVYNHQSVLGGMNPFGDDSSSGGDDGAAGLTTVTHFNLTHFKCHTDAAKADKRLKPPKSEWEGATIRNGHTLCNNIFPILQPPAAILGGDKSSSAASRTGSSNVNALLDPNSPLWDNSSDMDIVLEQYNNSVESYWQRISFHHNFVHPRIELLFEDTRTLLSRFALQESFSSISKGGGKESNVQFLPYLVQMSIFLAQCSATSSVKDRLEGHITTAMQVLGGIDTRMDAATSTSGGGGASTSTRSSSFRVNFPSIPFLNELPFGMSGSSSSSSQTTPSALLSAPTNLRTILSNQSNALDGFVTSAFTIGSERIRSTLYTDPTDYLEFVMVLSLSYCTREQWNRCKFGFMWRLIRLVKDQLTSQMDETEETTVTKPDVDMGVHASTLNVQSIEDEHKSSDATAAASVTPAATEESALFTELRPIVLFWSLIDALHSALSPPPDAPYSAVHSESFLSSTTTAWYRRWRRSFTRNASMATFRSILRRETDILRLLSGQVLREYEINTAAKDVATLFTNVGLTEAIEKEGFTVQLLIDELSQRQKPTPPSTETTSSS
jgi:hypothetical protein